MDFSLLQTLGLINAVILKREAANRFEILYGNASWLTELLPAADTTNAFPLDDESLYLQDFLLDATAFWDKNQQGQIHSGIWTEQRNNLTLRLEATAAIIDGHCLLVLNNLENEFQQRQETLQIARELLISNDKMSAQYDYVYEKLDTALRTQHDLESEMLPINEALNNAELGIIIVDHTLAPIRHNPTAVQLFDLAIDVKTEIPLKTLLMLFEQQFPEFERVFNSHSGWQGELFWHNPPQTNKWLKLALYPVFNEHNQTSHWLFVFSDISRLKHLAQRNEKLSRYDSVTDLPNRIHLLGQLEQRVSVNQAFTIVYFDIKRFKHVNEAYGHRAGDQVLVEVSNRAKKLIDKSDTLARVSGNEFAIILQQIGKQDRVTTFVSKLLESIAKGFYTSNGDKITIGVSVGVANYPSDATNVDELIKLADLAMYEAKKYEKSQVCYYSAELKEAVNSRLQLEKALKRALAQDQFELFLQPILDLQNDKIIKAEALIRWNREDGTVVMPDQFIPFAEQSGLIIPIGQWVIKRALEILKLINEFQPAVKIAINLSPRQVTESHFLRNLQDQIDRFGIEPKNIDLELTEGVLIENFDYTKGLLNQLRALGISISIDDFGTGYSSLAYLQKLPIDHLKIDRSFVNELENNDNDKAIVLAVIAMAHSLKMKVVAEGVENLDQKSFLLSNQCDTAQGFLFNRPMPLHDFCKLLRKQSL